MNNTNDESHRCEMDKKDAASASITPPRRRARQRDKAPRLDGKATDTLLRVFLALYGKPDTEPSPRADHPQSTPEPEQKVATLEDLVHVHTFGSVMFGSEENAREVLQQMVSHPALAPLDEVAKFTAAQHIFLSRMADKLKTAGSYWVLGGIGDLYPFPLGIRTGASPRWKRQIRSLEKLLKAVSASASQALWIEAGAIISSRPEQMPSELIFNAVTALRAAIAWMQAFPDPVQLRSKYREAVKPDEEKESLKVVAYRLSRLYREHAKEPLKVKDIECRIAELETAFLRQSIQYNSDFGCPAIRLQIRSVKRSSIRTAVDRQLRKDLQMIARKEREYAQKHDPDSFSKTLRKLMKRWDEHHSSSDAWWPQTEARLREDLRRRVIAASSPEELNEATGEHLRRMRGLLDLRGRWIEESDGHLKVLSAPETDVFEYSKVMRNWMKSWESLWVLPPEGIWFQMSSV